MLFSLTSAKGRNSRRQSPMTEVRPYWTNQKEAVPAAVVAMVEAVEVAVVVEEVAAVAVEILEGVDPPDWEDYSRLECRS